ncbi:MAG: ACP S-malonyltransferase [Acidobacteria bacterium]|nr:ACP S-malonyltransferase [Acidobacteriota bacterium]
MSRRAVVLCPGRASYGKAQLGSLSALDATPSASELAQAVAAVDTRREAAGDLTVRGMDGAEKFRSAFLEGHNAAPLIFAVTAFEALRLDPELVDVVAVGGNSMGWYSALWAAGALDLEGAFELIGTMGAMTRDGVVGGQSIYPVVDDDWRPSPDRAVQVDRALRQVVEDGHAAGDSIRFGGLRVLWGDDAAIAALAEALPTVKLGKTEYPLRLLGNSAFHSQLMSNASTSGRQALAGLPLEAPRVPLIDGTGRQWRPLTTSTDSLLSYTLGHQVTETFDFAATVRVALREYAPDVIVALGPGESLGGAVAQVLIAEGWQGIHNRDDFLERQADDPIVISLARPDQASLVARVG